MGKIKLITIITDDNGNEVKTGLSIYGNCVEAEIVNCKLDIDKIMDVSFEMRLCLYRLMYGQYTKLMFDQNRTSDEINNLEVVAEIDNNRCRVVQAVRSPYCPENEKLLKVERACV